MSFEQAVINLTSREQATFNEVTLAGEIKTEIQKLTQNAYYRPQVGSLRGSDEGGSFTFQPSHDKRWKVLSSTLSLQIERLNEQLQSMRVEQEKVRERRRQYETNGDQVPVNLPAKDADITLRIQELQHRKQSREQLQKRALDLFDSGHQWEAIGLLEDDLFSLEREKNSDRLILNGNGDSYDWIPPMVMSCMFFLLLFPYLSIYMRRRWAFLLLIVMMSILFVARDIKMLNGWLLRVPSLLDEKPFYGGQS